MKKTILAFVIALTFCGSVAFAHGPAGYGKESSRETSRPSYNQRENHRGTGGYTTPGKQGQWTPPRQTAQPEIRHWASGGPSVYRGQTPAPKIVPVPARVPYRQPVVVVPGCTMHPGHPVPPPPPAPHPQPHHPSLLKIIINHLID